VYDLSAHLEFAFTKNLPAETLPPGKIRRKYEPVGGWPDELHFPGAMAKVPMSDVLLAPAACSSKTAETLATRASAKGAMSPARTVVLTREVTGRASRGARDRSLLVSLSFNMAVAS
jgi:hypothetical protein